MAGGDSIAGEAFLTYVDAAEVCLIAYVGILGYRFVLVVGFIGFLSLYRLWNMHACLVLMFFFFFFAFSLGA